MNIYNHYSDFISNAAGLVGFDPTRAVSETTTSSSMIVEEQANVEELCSIADRRVAISRAEKEISNAKYLIMHLRLKYDSKNPLKGVYRCYRIQSAIRLLIEKNELSYLRSCQVSEVDLSVKLAMAMACVGARRPDLLSSCYNSIELTNGLSYNAELLGIHFNKIANGNVSVDELKHYASLYLKEEDACRDVVGLFFYCLCLGFCKTKNQDLKRMMFSCSIVKLKILLMIDALSVVGETCALGLVRDFGDFLRETMKPRFSEKNRFLPVELFIKMKFSIINGDKDKLLDSYKKFNQILNAEYDQRRLNYYGDVQLSFNKDDVLYSLMHDCIDNQVPDLFVFLMEDNGLCPDLFNGLTYERRSDGLIYYQMDGDLVYCGLDYEVMIRNQTRNPLVPSYYRLKTFEYLAKRAPDVFLKVHKDENFSPDDLYHKTFLNTVGFLMHDAILRSENPYVKMVNIVLGMENPDIAIAREYCEWINACGNAVLLRDKVMGEIDQVAARQSSSVITTVTA